MGEDRGDLTVGQRFQRALADHHAAAHARQAIREGLFDVEDAQAAGRDTDLRRDRFVGHVEQVDHHPVMGAPAPGGDRDLQHGDE
jgi:hypothetical protein